METVTAWGYSLKISDAVALGALVIAGIALWISWLAYRLNRNSLSLYEGGDYGGPVLYINNNSPHAVTVANIGFVGPDGRSASLLSEDGLRIRIDHRDESFIRISDEMAATVRRAKSTYSRHCLFVQLATGHKFYNASLSRRMWWWTRGFFDGSRRIRDRTT
ncbi:hypothetical protein [Pseudomonas sp. CHM02]|uniref:hypothetical protein n=1 Tax=Pseudomonas sp. CHM02 TaxID=1463662 RepID=UPI0012DF8FD0|nr:hypothetical protein [Pseudomonas sp. CHM02]